MLFFLLKAYSSALLQKRYNGGQLGRNMHQITTLL